MRKHIMILNSLAITAEGTPMAETYKAAIEALTKQEPAKVINVDKFDVGTCPGCNRRITLRFEPNYCHICGQALKY